jgi:hypothetical protein
MHLTEHRPRASPGGMRKTVMDKNRAGETIVQNWIVFFFLSTLLVYSVFFFIINQNLAEDLYVRCNAYGTQLHTAFAPRRCAGIGGRGKFPLALFCVPALLSPVRFDEAAMTPAWRTRNDFITSLGTRPGTVRVATLVATWRNKGLQRTCTVY